VSETFGLTTSGLNIMRLADIKAALEASFQSEFGSAVNLDAATPEGQLIGIIADREALIWELIELVYAAYNPDSAAGQALDALCALNNIVRLDPVPSSCTSDAGNSLVITGTVGAVVPIGFTVHKTGDTSATFATEEEFTIGALGTVDADFYCTSVSADSGLVGGPVVALAGSLVNIDTPNADVTAVTQPSDATVGRDVETDAELRLRRNQSLSIPSAASVNGIYSSVSAVDDVTSCTVYENITDVTDMNGLPPHSFQVVVQGGADADIAAAIWTSKPAGIKSYGNHSEVTTDSQGRSQTMYFSRPTPLVLYVKCNIVKNTDSSEGAVYPSNGDALVAAAILEFGNQAIVGRDVVPSQFYTPINTVPGVWGISLKIDIIAVPVFTGVVVVGQTELASFDSSRITVIS
jgi:uncharacterized phage protein gp47/JayE